MNDLDLSSLSTGPVPTLAAVSDVRARGDQRKQRGRVLVAGAAALLVLAGAGTAVALTDRSTPDALQIANTPTPSAAATDPEPAETGVLRASARLLTPADATRVAGGTWTAGDVYAGASLALIVCPTGDGSAGTGVRRGLQGRDFGVSNQVVFQTDAGRWVNALKQEVRDCPRRAADSEDGKASDAFELVDVAPGASLAFSLAAIRDTYRDCDTCTPHVTYWLVVAVGDYLSYAALPESEEPRLLAWSVAMYQRLRDPVPNPPSPSPMPSSEPVVFGPLGPQDLVESDRIGPVVIGMTLAQAEEAADQPLKQEGDDLGGCVYYTPRSGQPDVSFMVIDGVVSRIDVDSGTTTTNVSIGIGSTEAEVKGMYRNAVVSKHPYTDGHYLRVLDEDGQHAILFETDGQKVTSFRSGYPSAVDQIEGCA
jgi:hypothetical protein